MVVELGNLLMANTRARIGLVHSAPNRYLLDGRIEVVCHLSTIVLIRKAQNVIVEVVQVFEGVHEVVLSRFGKLVVWR